jgi:hypothetical protein
VVRDVDRSFKPSDNEYVEKQMFDIKRAFLELNGRIFTQSEFREALERIRAANMRFLPAEYGTHELATLAEERHWLKKETPGKLRVVIPQRKSA